MKDGGAWLTLIEVPLKNKKSILTYPDKMLLGVSGIRKNYIFLKLTQKAYLLIFSMIKAEKANPHTMVDAIRLNQR